MGTRPAIPVDGDKWLAFRRSRRRIQIKEFIRGGVPCLAEFRLMHNGAERREEQKEIQLTNVQDTLLSQIPRPPTPLVPESSLVPTFPIADHPDAGAIGQPGGVFAAYGMHRERGQETVETIVRMFAGHALNHFQQIEHILAAKKP